MRSPRARRPRCCSSRAASCFDAALRAAPEHEAGKEWRPESRLRMLRGAIDLTTASCRSPLLRMNHCSLANGLPARLAEPVGDQNRWKRAEVRSRHIADRVARVLIDDQALGPATVAPAVACARPATARRTRRQRRDTGTTPFGVALPGHALPQLVEPGLVGDARHVHEAHLEGRRRLLEDRVTAGVGTPRHRDGRDPRLVGGGDGAEEGAELVPDRTTCPGSTSGAGEPVATAVPVATQCPSRNTCRAPAPRTGRVRRC